MGHSSMRFIVTILLCTTCIYGGAFAEGSFHNASSPNALLAVGGFSRRHFSLKACRIYNASLNGPWLPIAKMHHPRYAAGVATLNNVVYAVGGGNAGGRSMSSGEHYSYDSNRWQAIKPLAEARNSLAVVAFQGTLVAFGGYSNSKALKSAEQYLPANGTWQPFANMTTARDGHGAAVLGDCIYAIAGHQDQFTYLSSAERYCNKGWNPIASLTVKRAYFGTATIGGLIYVCGGHFTAQRSSDHYYSLCQRYDPSQDSWSIVEPLPAARGFLGMAALQGAIYAVGGSDKQGSHSDAYKYSPTTNKWTSVQGLFPATSDLGLTAIYADTPITTTTSTTTTPGTPPTTKAYDDSDALRYDLEGGSADDSP